MRSGLFVLLFWCCTHTYAQQVCVANKPLFNNEVHLIADPAPDLTVFNQPKSCWDYEFNSLQKIFRLQQPDRLPVFCAIEKSISQKFNFPVRIRLDDRKYEYR